MIENAKARKPKQQSLSDRLKGAASPHYTLPVHVAPSAWRYPPGAFRHTAGPT